MVKGFYNLTSGMLTQRRTLDVISTNMSNVSTIGYKADTLLSSTFDEALLSRTGNEDKAYPEGLADTSMARIPRETVTNFDIGNLRPSYSPLDFAIISDGFFQVQNENGEVRYTRNGSFNLDNQGYLILPGMGRVMGTNGPIQVDTDDLTIDSQGRITSAEDGRYFGTLDVVDFADYGELTKVTGGVFTTGAAPMGSNAVVTQKFLEDSNVNLAEQMTAMMSSQRVLQGSAQILRMYDQLISRATALGSPT